MAFSQYRWSGANMFGVFSVAKMLVEMLAPKPLTISDDVSHPARPASLDVLFWNEVLYRMLLYIEMPWPQCRFWPRDPEKFETGP